jgi:hypothetical protein
MLDHAVTKIKDHLLEHQAGLHLEQVFDGAVEQYDGEVDSTQHQKHTDTRAVDCGIYGPSLQLQRYDPERGQDRGQYTKTDLMSSAAAPDVPTERIGKCRRRRMAFNVVSRIRGCT